MIDFANVIKELGDAMGIPLEADEKECCLISHPDGLQVQLELEPTRQETVVIISPLGQVPVGRYREDLFVSALKANGAPFPRHGTLAFNVERELLVLCDSIFEQNCDSRALLEYVEGFTAKAKKWKEALEQEIIPQEDLPGPTGSSGIFGLSP